MTKKKLNVFIIIMVICIALFFAGAFAYEEYRIWKSDQEAAQDWENSKEQLENDHTAGDINEDLEGKKSPDA